MHHHAVSATIRGPALPAAPILAVMSFLLDPPALVVSGAVAAGAGVPPHVRRLLRRGTVAVFVGTSAALYLNAAWTRPLVRLFRARSGRDWMINSGVTRFEHERPRRIVHLAAVAMFATYPRWYRLGERFGSRFRR